MGLASFGRRGAFGTDANGNTVLLDDDFTFAGIDRTCADVTDPRTQLRARLDALHAGEVDSMIPAGDYFFQAIDEYLTDTGAWSDGVRSLKRAARKVRAARKRRRGWA